MAAVLWRLTWLRVLLAAVGAVPGPLLELSLQITVLPMRAAQGFILCDACDHLFTAIFRVLSNSKMELYGFLS